MEILFEIIYLHEYRDGNWTRTLQVPAKFTHNEEGNYLFNGYE